MTIINAKYLLNQRATEEEVLTNIAIREQRIALNTRRNIIRPQSSADKIFYEGGYPVRYSDRFDTWQEIVDSIPVGESCHVLVTSTLYFSSSTTIPDTITLEFLKGGKLVATGGSVEIIIQGNIIASQEYIFVANSGASYNFASVNTRAVFPEWFGAVGDGIADDSTAFNLACNCSSDGNINVFLSSKTYYIGSDITLMGLPVNIIGVSSRGSQSSKLQFVGTAKFNIRYAFSISSTVIEGSNLIFNVTNSSDIVDSFTMDDCKVQFIENGSNVSDSLIRIDDTPTTIMSRSRFYLSQGPYASNGIQVIEAANTESLRVSECYFSGCLDTAIHTIETPIVSIIDSSFVSCNNDTGGACIFINEVLESSTVVTSVSISNTVFKDNVIHAIKRYSDTTDRVGNIKISNCNITGSDLLTSLNAGMIELGGYSPDISTLVENIASDASLNSYTEGMSTFIGCKFGTTDSVPINFSGNANITMLQFKAGTNDVISSIADGSLFSNLGANAIRVPASNTTLIKHGSIVYMSTTGIDVNPISGASPFGVAYTDIPAYQGWAYIVTSGRAEVLLENSTTVDSGDYIVTSETTAGRVESTGPTRLTIATAIQLNQRVLGIAIDNEAVGGTDVLIKISLSLK